MTCSAPTVAVEETAAVLAPVRDRDGALVGFEAVGAGPDAPASWRSPAVAVATFERCARVARTGRPEHGDVLVSDDLVLEHRVVACPPNVVSLLCDVTAQRRRQEQDRARLAVAAHDLRDPLNGLALVAGLLEAADAEQQGAIDLLVSGLDRARRRTDAILRDAARAHAPVDCTAVVHQATATLAAAVEVAGAVVRIGDLPEVDGDSDQLARVFQNLIANALKFRAPGRAARVEVDARADRDGWRIEVRDNGVGIAPDARVFGLYARGDDPGAVQGSGIGLAVCRRIVEDHGGRIWAQARPGGGTTIALVLPARGPQRCPTLISPDS